MLKPIETVYNGYRFRSRLEARWAVFFDTLGVRYEYEPEGYDLGEAGWYLPDFWLPQQEYWIEIKGVFPTEREERRLADLVVATGKMGFIFFGEVPYPHPGDFAPFYTETDSAIAIYPVEGAEEEPYGWDNCHAWCECHACGALGIHYEGRGARISCGCDHKEHGNGDRCHAYCSPRLLEAYTAARQARFEHRAA